MKNSFLFLLFLSTCFAAAQSEERKTIYGQISVPEGYEPEGIHVFNKTSGYGTASGPEGSFELPMASKDTLQFSGLQFSHLEVTITDEIMESGELRVEIYPGLNELPEILIRSHELTGNIREDLDRIEVEQLPSIPRMQDIRKLPVEKMTPRNSVVNEIGGGANHLELLVKGIKLLFPGKVKKEPAPKTHWSPYEQVGLERELRSRFDEQFFRDNFEIPQTQISDFVSFVAENGFNDRLLRQDKEMELIQFLMEQSAVFRQGK